MGNYTTPRIWGQGVLFLTQPGGQRWPMLPLLWNNVFLWWKSDLILDHIVGLSSWCETSNTSNSVFFFSLFFFILKLIVNEKKHGAVNATQVLVFSFQLKHQNRYSFSWYSVAIMFILSVLASESFPKGNMLPGILYYSEFPGRKIRQWSDI